ncbi:hypothetical protein 8G_00051 [Ralstonia phage Hyacinthe]|uniref:Uncharacterized protein n=3 Tax=Rahariannevirus raharianne TaxID=2846050 RepID=A0A7G5BBG6_9CAUD|nr:hypothetical protein KMC43_gp70 [Ralstonia phage Raharianne]QMV32445.1 hypothetical protein U2_00070 [Ralstonia phage Albius]QMV33483.1 hypothetical protein 8G_00051 [Ralstonia phage Hyacinthe]QMV33639.1 hypothetical protein Y2_00070 [Ralstonia phage Raharianne]
MRVESPEIVEYKEYRTMADAYGPGATLEKDDQPSWKDWAKAIGIGAAVGVWLYLVAAYRAGAIF